MLCLCTAADEEDDEESMWNVCGADLGRFNDSATHLIFDKHSEDKFQLVVCKRPLRLLYAHTSS